MSLNIWDFTLFFFFVCVKIAPPPLEKVTPLFSSNPLLSKLRSCQAPPPWKFGRRFNSPQQKGGGGGRGGGCTLCLNITGNYMTMALWLTVHYGNTFINNCNWCLSEKAFIITNLDDVNILNKRSEFISKCWHINAGMCYWILKIKVSRDILACHPFFSYSFISQKNTKEKYQISKICHWKLIFVFWVSTMWAHKLRMHIDMWACKEHYYVCTRTPTALWYMSI